MAITVACAFGQLALGAQPMVVTLAVIATVVGLLAFRIGGSLNSGAWLALCFALGNVIIALIAKTLLLQPLDSNLYAPRESFLAITVGTGVMLLALVVARIVPVGKAIFLPIHDPRKLEWLSNSSFLLGALAWYVNRLFSDPDGSGFGGASLFWNLLLMAVIARTALILQRSSLRRSTDLRLALILLACVVMGLVDNQKTKVALPIVAYFATTLFFRRMITGRQLVAAGVGALLMTAVVGPMIHAFRGLGIQELTWQRRVDLIERGIERAFQAGDIEKYQRLASSQFVSGYYNYFGDVGGQMVLGRYASIQQVDPVVADVVNSSPLGGDAIWAGLERQLPSFVHPNKPKFIESYQILVKLGRIRPDGGQFPTVPLVAQSFAAYGAMGLVVIPLLTFTIFLIALKKLGWQLHRNVFAIFFFSVFVVVYANQADFAQYAGTVLRTFPALALTLWLIVRFQPSRAALSPHVNGIGTAGPENR